MLIDAVYQLLSGMFGAGVQRLDGRGRGGLGTRTNLLGRDRETANRGRMFFCQRTHLHYGHMGRGLVRGDACAMCPPTMCAPQDTIDPRLNALPPLA